MLHININMLHTMYAVNIILLLVIIMFCARYRIMQKLLRRITHIGGGIITDGVIDPVNTQRYNFMLDVYKHSPIHNLSDKVIIMLGDSLTDNTPFNELTQFRFHIKNRGISSDNTRGVLHRINESGIDNAAKIFILLGINDIGNGIELTESMRNYRTIIDSIKKISPETRIYIQSVFPVDHKKLENNARCRRRTSEAIKNFNAGLIKLADETQCSFIDTYSIFEVNNSGEMNNNYTDDGLHLNGAGMMIWVKFLDKYFAE
ncbi:MAG: hypothetical protein IJP48_10550 [Synergistaceae bacterium]|nr:hypothetical protein [Synergistaceae bacterium]